MGRARPLLSSRITAQVATLLTDCSHASRCSMSEASPPRTSSVVSSFSCWLVCASELAEPNDAPASPPAAPEFHTDRDADRLLGL